MAKIIQIETMITGLKQKRDIPNESETTCILFGLDENGTLFSLDGDNKWVKETESPK